MPTEAPRMKDAREYRPSDCRAGALAKGESVNVRRLPTVSAEGGPAPQGNIPGTGEPPAPRPMSFAGMRRPCPVRIRPRNALRAAASPRPICSPDSPAPASWDGFRPFLVQQAGRITWRRSYGSTEGMPFSQPHFRRGSGRSPGLVRSRRLAQVSAGARSDGAPPIRVAHYRTMAGGGMRPCRTDDTGPLKLAGAHVR